jgi:hypothetical protein
MKFAMACGNRMRVITTMVENHKRIVLRTFGLHLHLLRSPCLMETKRNKE